MRGRGLEHRLPGWAIVRCEDGTDPRVVPSVARPVPRTYLSAQTDAGEHRFARGRCRAMTREPRTSAYGPGGYVDAEWSVGLRRNLYAAVHPESGGIINHVERSGLPAQGEGAMIRSRVPTTD